MKKIIVVLIIGALLGFIILNYKPFLAYYYNHLGNTFYGNEEYFPAISSHTKASSLLGKDEFHYNIGNDYFQIGELQTSTGTQLAYYQLSLDSYTKLLEKEKLDLEFYKKVKENYEIVKRKIEELTSKKNEEEEDEEKKKEEDGDEEDKSAENKDDEKEGDEKEQESEDNEGKDKEDKDKKESTNKEDSSNNSEEGDESEGDTGEERDIEKNNDQGENKNSLQEQDTNSLLPAEKKQIQKYIENLKDQGEQNMQFFNKKSSEASSIQDTFFNSFSNNAFFDDVFDRGGEKDW